MYVLFTGPRHCRPNDIVNALMVHLRWRITVPFSVVEGGAPGVDAQARSACSALGIGCRTEPADWTGPCRDTCHPGHRRKRRDGSDFCPAAGNYRNQHMLDRYQPRLVVAVLDRPLTSTRGTRDMLSRARAADVEVVEVYLSRGFAEAIRLLDVGLDQLEAA